MEVERIKQELDTEELCLRYDMLNENDSIANLASADAGLVMAHMKCFAVNSVEERYEELLRRRWDAWYPAVAPPTLEATAAERAWLISSRKQFALVFAKQQYDASHKSRDGMDTVTDAWLDQLREEARRHHVIARYQHVYGQSAALCIEGLARKDASVPTANCALGADFDEENVAEVVDILTADWRPRLAWIPGV
ncbi:hypothetical protein BDY17DRAFT_324528 [Neohortaea acidophila]|uniref:Uncharacterized protein n=1 Tax=Neohortaea acidophila TaxID=245834 RepID=A0A6A6PQE6_9PEZI|nr:uncharacterized protein BDY17DRAFT_324528 [Neohortaea acidophila]KAF2482232.1 hypothetical protein BDY17DRAFT_324528 [Neohortaea acidophila]